MKRTLKSILKIGIALGGLALVSFPFFGNKKYECPKTFKSINSHFENMKAFAINYGDGLKKFGADLDFDYDNMNDLYFTTNNGKLYHTNSRRFLDGSDNVNERIFSQDEIERLNEVKSGQYSSP